MLHLKELWHSVPAIVRLIIAVATGLSAIALGLAPMTKLYLWIRWIVWDRKVYQYMIEQIDQRRSEGKRTSGVVFLQSNLAAGMGRSEPSIVKSLKRLQKRGEVHKVLSPDVWVPIT
jgi:hypothetical protein